MAEKEAEVMADEMPIMLEENNNFIILYFIILI